MRKIIKRKIHISTHKRDLIDFINDEFYSHDKHNAFLEFTMKSLPTDNIIALFYFQKTKRYVETKAFVDGDKFTIEFDTSLINTDETILGFIYFEKVAQSADVHRFSFGVKVSEIDKLHDIPIEEAKTKRVVAIEDIVTKAELDELFKRIEKNGGTYDDTEIRSSISSIETRVQTLEAKSDKDTRYDDSDVKSRLNVLETNANRYLTEHQPLTSVEERIQQVEARFNNLSNIYLSSHQSLEHLATKVALNAVEQRVEQLEQHRGSDNHDFLTRQELESKHYLTSVPEEYARKSDIPQPYNDSALTERVSLLEAKAISNGAYDDKPLLDKIHAIEEQFRNASNLYLQSHQSLEHLVTKKELEDKHYLTSVPEEVTNQISALETKVQTLENKSVVTHEELENAGYAKTTDLTDLAANSKVEEVESRVLALENKPSIDTNEFAKKSEIPQAYDDSALSGRVSALEAKDFVEGKSDYHLLKHQVEELVKQNQVLQEQLALVKPAPRRAPMAYTLDKSSVPWTIWFDNGCGLQLPSYAETATIYGYGQSINLQHKEWYAFPLVGNIISLSRGILTLDNVKNTVNAIYWAEDTTVLNPIKNKDDYTWITARCGEKGSKHQWAWEREANIVRVMYQLGIWDAKTVESLGAVKR